MEEKKQKKQLQVFQTLRKVFDDMKAQYDIDEEKLSIYVSTKGEDLTIPIMFTINTQFDTLCSYSTIPFKVKDESLQTLLFGITVINSKIPFGAFFINFQTVEIMYRAELFFSESIVSETTIKGLIGLSLNIIDLYNDKLMALNNGILDLKGFLEAI